MLKCRERATAAAKGKEGTNARTPDQWLSTGVASKASLRTPETATKRLKTNVARAAHGSRADSAEAFDPAHLNCSRASSVLKFGSDKYRVFSFFSFV
jgi:hypothetical protein